MMTYEAALAQARAEAAPLGSPRAANHPTYGEQILAPRVREIMDAARRAEDQQRREEQARTRREWLDSHSPEWHAHQRTLASLGPTARCEPGCPCEQEPW